MSTQENECLLFSLDEGVATLSLNRPKACNALNADLIQALLSQIQNLAQNPKVKALVLQGEGPHFSAGGDIHWMKEGANSSPSENRKAVSKLALLFKSLNEFPKPSLCLVQGAVFGGAIGLVACSDITLAETNAVFCFSEVKLGLVPALISPYVIDAIGLRAARRYFLTAERLNAEQAYDLSLVHELVLDKTEAQVKLKILLEHILQNGPQAVKKTKALLLQLNRLKNSRQAKSQTLVEETLAKVRRTLEAKEGIQAFLEKRPAKWIS